MEQQQRLQNAFDDASIVLPYCIVYGFRFNTPCLSTPSSFYFRKDDAAVFSLFAQAQGKGLCDEGTLLYDGCRDYIERFSMPRDYQSVPKHVVPKRTKEYLQDFKKIFEESDSNKEIIDGEEHYRFSKEFTAFVYTAMRNVARELQLGKGSPEERSFWAENYKGLVKNEIGLFDRIGLSPRSWKHGLDAIKKDLVI